MKLIVVLFIAFVVQTFAITSGLKVFTGEFTVTASAYNRGFFNGQVYYDWSQNSLILTFPVADEYSELYIFNSGSGYNTNLLNGQFSGQYKYRNSSHCLCETTSLLSSMPLFYIDDDFTVNGNKIWIKDTTPQKQTYQGKTCDGYTINPSASPNNQLVNYFWQTPDGIPCGFTFKDGRTFTFFNIRDSNVSPIPAGRFNPPVDCKCGKPLDVVLSLDRTGSIQIWEWFMQRNFTLNLAAAFDYGPLKTNLGIVNWNSNFWKTLDITTGVSSDVVMKAVQAMTCCITTTNIYASCCCCGTPIGGGLYYAAQMMLTSNRATATKIIILLTDGCQNHIYDPSFNPPKVTACTCQSSTEQSCQSDAACVDDIKIHYQEVTANIPGIKIIAVGVGSDKEICQSQLNEVAGGIPQNIFRPQSWQDLSNMVQSISSTACDVEDKTCIGCCGICSCGTCIKPINCSAPDMCSNAIVDKSSNCCSIEPIVCPKKPCFTESCAPLTGCVYTPIACPLGDNCTTWSCDNITSSATLGQCKPTTCPAKPQCIVNKDCDDNNNCTIDTCTPSQNCTWTTVNCGTTDNCTKYECNILTGCKTTKYRTCNDFNLCTRDSCDGAVDGGCVFTPIKCNDTLDGCYKTKCLPSVGCYNELIQCNLTTTNCSVVGCVNGTCGRVNICLPPPPPAGSETPIVAIVGGTIGAAALAGIIIGAVALVAGLAGGGAAAFAHAGAGGGASSIFNNPLYHDTSTKGTSPLYKPA